MKRDPKKINLIRTKKKEERKSRGEGLLACVQGFAVRALLHMSESRGMGISGKKKKKSRRSRGFFKN